MTKEFPSISGWRFQLCVSKKIYNICSKYADSKKKTAKLLADENADLLKVKKPPELYLRCCVDLSKSSGIG
jgi:hypothetical protein